MNKTLRNIQIFEERFKYNNKDVSLYDFIKYIKTLSFYERVNLFRYIYKNHLNYFSNNIDDIPICYIHRWYIKDGKIFFYGYKSENYKDLCLKIIKNKLEEIYNSYMRYCKRYNKTLKFEF